MPTYNRKDIPKGRYCVKKNCLQCNKPFYAKTSKAIFCKTLCRKYYNQEKNSYNKNILTVNQMIISKASSEIRELIRETLSKLGMGIAHQNKLHSDIESILLRITDEIRHYERIKPSGMYIGLNKFIKSE